MSRLKLTLLVLGLTLTGFLIGWEFHGRPDRHGNTRAIIRLLTEPQVLVPILLKEAELRIRGGVGITIISDQSGLLKVHSAAAGSPAALAGLKGGELISHIDGTPVLGVPFTNAADLFRGLNGTQVELTIQKPDSTNWESVLLRRVSMRKAIELNSRSPYE